jgi:hypothetical protein
MEGIAAETKIPMLDLAMALNDGMYFAVGVQATRDKALKKIGLIRRGCTVAGFSNGMLGQNNDNPTKYSGANTLVKSVDDRIMLLTMGSPFVWLMGMSKSLAVCVNTIDAFFAGHDLRDGGLPESVLIMNALMNYKTVDEVISKYRDAKMLVALSVTFADKDGGLGTIEFNARQFTANIMLRPGKNEHFIAHTNHPRNLEEYLVRTWFDGDKGKANRMLARTIWRQEYAENFLGHSAKKSLAELKLLFRSYPVLFHGSDGLDFRATTSVIWDIPNQVAYISPDRPDLTEYERVTWSSD